MEAPASEDFAQGLERRGNFYESRHVIHPMKKSPLFFSALIAFALFSPLSAWAAKSDTPKSSKAKLIEKYDANKNGKLDAEESAQLKSDFLADPRGELRKLDTNQNGKIDDDEIAALTNEKRAKAGERKPAGKKKKDL